MDGVFMFKLLKLALVALLIAGAFQIGQLVADYRALHDGIIRLHVVANSDSEEDQALKLEVRDAVIELIQAELSELATKVDAQAFLEEHLEDIAEAANAVIEKAGLSDKVTVTLTQEAFDTREYDSFTLPAGVYDSLRIVIGEGEGHNWWCVVFPSLCLPQENYKAEAAGAGFSDTLTQTLSNDGGYEIRFWILDCIGRICNFLKN